MKAGPSDLTTVVQEIKATHAYPNPSRTWETTLKVSLIAPAFNEEDRIVDFLHGAMNVLDTLGHEYEILVVDDGSTDHTRERAASVASNPHIRVVGYSQNQGKGWAARYGMRHVQGDIAIFMDSDNEVSAENLRHYVKALQDADTAIASKRHPDSIVSTPILRRFLSCAFNVLVQLTTGVRSSDTQAGLKAVGVGKMRQILPLLSVKRYAFDVEVLAVASLLKMKVVELPVAIRLGALFSVRHIVRIFVDLMGIVYRLRVKRWYQANLHNSQAEYRPLIR